MRVLLDENVDELLKGLFGSDFEVLTVRERGWAGKANGELLRAAEHEFEAMVTMDRNLQYQQNLRVLQLGVVVIRAPKQRVPGRRPADSAGGRRVADDPTW